jgi:hypothetical protein
MSTASILFNCVIRLYVPGHGEFELYNEFSNDIISSDYRLYKKYFFKDFSIIMNKNKKN